MQIIHFKICMYRSFHEGDLFMIMSKIWLIYIHELSIHKEVFLQIIKSYFIIKACIMTVDTDDTKWLQYECVNLKLCVDLAELEYEVWKYTAFHFLLRQIEYCPYFRSSFLFEWTIPIVHQHSSMPRMLSRTSVNTKTLPLVTHRPWDPVILSHVWQKSGRVRYFLYQHGLYWEKVN